MAELARRAQTEAHRLDMLVGNLLDLSRLEAGALQAKRETHDVRNMIGAALGEVQGWQARRIETTVQPGLPLVQADFVLIVQVLVNLLDNAVKYSPAGAPVELEAQLRGREIEIRVSDCGDGVPAAERENIFEKFSRGARTQYTPGVGLGLAICKGFVEAHHGRIWVEDRARGGSVFCFTIPLHDPLNDRGSNAGGT